MTPDPTPPPGWAYVAAVHQLDKQVRQVLRTQDGVAYPLAALLAAAERVEVEQAKLTPAGIGRPTPHLDAIKAQRDQYAARLAALRQLYADNADGPPISGDWLMGRLRELTADVPPAEREG